MKVSFSEGKTGRIVMAGGIVMVLVGRPYMAVWKADWKKPLAVR